MGLGTLIKTYLEEQGKCAYCKKSITEEQVEGHSIHTHHMTPRGHGGGSTSLRLLHQDCHNRLHQTLSRHKMADFINKSIDCLRLMRPAMR